MIFDLIRFVLVSRAQTSLFDARSDDGSVLSRDLWLRAVFANKIDFLHRSQRFVFLPMKSEIENLLFGRIGRQHKVVENASPEENFDVVTREAWTASLVIIDPSSHSDGQKMAIETKPGLASPLPLIQSLTKHVNDIVRGPYILEANAISNKQSFWDFEKENKGKIVAVSFEMTAPNMFGVREKIDEDMAELRDEEKATSAVLVIKNPEGLRLDTDRVRQTVGYTLEGGGAIKARTKGRKRFNSNRKIKTVTVAEVELESDSLSATIGRAASRIFGV